MNLVLKGHRYQYDLENLSRVFFPAERIKISDGIGEPEEPWVVATRQDMGTCLRMTVEARVQGQRLKRSCDVPVEAGRDDSLDLCVLYYRVLSQLTGMRPDWGVLTGVRPAKLMHRLERELGGRGAAAKYFQDSLLVTPEKTAFTQRVTAMEDPVIALSRPESYSLYVSIPFCPTRCSYCSFVSHSMESAKGQIDPYVERLERELQETLHMARDLNLRLETVYFGGGTPTILSAKQLERLFQTIEAHADLSRLREYTVEAGRPDTITAEKLAVMKAHGVSRISINPQSFSDGVLNRIGRSHTAAEAQEAYQLARSYEFDSVNMDFIAGLPGDGYESFCHSVDKALELLPENITIHTLALKRAAYLVTEEGRMQSAQAELAARMLRYVDENLSRAGYAPYYMYRQSKSAGNLENVGWCRDNRPCLYNIFMMDETHTVLAAGAGAVTKLCRPGENSIERIYNFKYPFEYISRFSDMLSRKARIPDFYGAWLSS